MHDLAASLKASYRQHAEGTVKTWEDLERYRRIIANISPQIILEAGTFSGKSALWFARNADCPVVTVDVDPRNVDDATRSEAEDAGVVFLTGRSTSVDILSAMRVAAKLIVGPVMVVLDSDHSADTVHEEMVEYGTLVTVGSYMVVEDGIVRWMPDQMKPKGPYRGSPLDAIEGFLESRGKCWKQDMEIEGMYPATQFPGGFLQRLS